MRNLLLTLGHNSSAILIEDGQLVCGYETERITGIKSDSQFPLPAIEEIAKFHGKQTGDHTNIDMAYVTHWSPDGQLGNMSAKHWKPEVFDGIPIRTLTPDRTHHDTHMAAAMCYAGPTFPYNNRAFGFVIDGFGTYGEHLSVYALHGGKAKLVKRVHGYGTSLGLWYQYATAFMGMKMHEDEYKLLGYEVHIHPHLAKYLAEDASQTAVDVLLEMDKTVYGSKFDPLFNLSALADVKNRIWKHLATICKKHNLTDSTTPEGRVPLAFYVQSVLEKVVALIIEEFNPSNVILSGGVFYNVKLNKMIMDKIDGRTCVYPLCGDQGNAIGLYAMDHPEFRFPETLFWGKRKLEDKGEVPGLVVCGASAALVHVQNALRRRGYVNLVRGNMEFGPRALCNTSTLALPHPDIVSRINSANNRNTVMPMAPVMTAAQWKARFEDVQKPWKSYRHMVIAMEYREHPMPGEMGIAHAYHYPYKHQTGRPQVVENADVFMERLLNEFGPLINTSFNFHGMPIALGMESIIKNHMMQYQRDDSFTTVVIANDD